MLRVKIYWKINHFLLDKIWNLSLKKKKQNPKETVTDMTIVFIDYRQYRLQTIDNSTIVSFQKSARNTEWEINKLWEKFCINKIFISECTMLHTICALMPENNLMWECIGFTWKGFGSRGAADVVSVRRHQELPHVRHSQL